jgi:hypothetical protein
MKISQLREWLTDEVRQAADTAQESVRVAPNSYGAGHDTGWLQALERVALFLDGKLDT